MCHLLRKLSNRKWISQLKLMIQVLTIQGKMRVYLTKLGTIFLHFFALIDITVLLVTFYICFINEFFFLNLFSERNFFPFKNFSFPPFYASPFFGISPHFKELFVSLPWWLFLGSPIYPLAKGVSMQIEAKVQYNEKNYGVC